jgi:hypothetical protein
MDEFILDALFHGCALAAYLDQAAEQRGWPDREPTRRRAYVYYEAELAARKAACHGSRISHSSSSERAA